MTKEEDKMNDLINSEKLKEKEIKISIMTEVQPKFSCSLVKNLSYSMKKESKKYSVYPEGYIDLETLNNLTLKFEEYYKNIKEMNLNINKALKEGTTSFIPENFISCPKLKISLYEGLVLYKALNNLIRGSENFKYTSENYEFIKGIMEEIKTEFIKAFYDYPL